MALGIRAQQAIYKCREKQIKRLAKINVFKEEDGKPYGEWRWMWSIEVYSKRQTRIPSYCITPNQHCKGFEEKKYAYASAERIVKELGMGRLI
jgi:hypothetical protein